MKQRPRIHYTESQKALMWERWQKGESLQQIAELFDRNHSSIQPILAASGLSENETQVPSGERAAFLSKPFTSEAMLQTVAHLLAGSGGEGEGRQA